MPGALTGLVDTEGPRREVGKPDSEPTVYMGSGTLRDEIAYETIIGRWLSWDCIA